MRGTHINPVQGEKKNHHLSASDSGSAEVARSESGPTKPEPINFKSGRII